MGNSNLKRCGITTRPNERRREWERELGVIQNWNLVQGFSSREEAQDWEDNHDQTWQKHGGGREPNDKDAKWYGYEFEHQGEMCTIL